MPKLLKDAWLPVNASVKCVVSHWTGGGYKVNDSELQPYHFLIDGAGVVHKGDPEVGHPGAHTRMFNTGTVGVSICAMHNADPGGPYGLFPLKKSQWEISTQVTAEICFRYGLPITPRTVVQHGEVRKRFPEIFKPNTTWNKVSVQGVLVSRGAGAPVRAAREASVRKRRTLMPFFRAVCVTDSMASA